MKIVVDRSRCITSGMCTSIAPEIFEIDDDGALSIQVEVPPGDLLEQVESAIACCPVEALSLTEG